jgi:prepilin-type N-terminal cleavage/methylation domain-containing protein
MRATQVQRGPDRRLGFTLVELLVVLTIVAVLVALSSAAILRYTEVQKKNNTQATLNKLTSVLKTQWNAVTEQANREAIPPTVLAWIQTNIEPIDPKRQRAVYVKLRQQQAFPMSFLEILTPTGPLPAMPKYLLALSGLGFPAAITNATFATPIVITSAAHGLMDGDRVDIAGVVGNTAANGIWTVQVVDLNRFQLQGSVGNSAYTSGGVWASHYPSACLLLALQAGYSGGGFQPEELGTGATQIFQRGTGQVPYLVDGWGTPLEFIRWPALSPDLNPGGAQAGYNNDPGDPDGTFTVASWQTNATTSPTFYQNFLATFGYAPPPRTAGSAATSFRLVPIIVSAGPDRIMALDATGGARPAGNPAANDNISSAAQ